MPQINAAYIRNLTNLELCRIFRDYQGDLDQESNRIIVKLLTKRLENLELGVDPGEVISAR